MKARDYFFVAAIVVAALAVWNFGPAVLRTAGSFIGGGWAAVTAPEANLPTTDGNRVEAPVAAPEVDEIAPNPADLCAGLVNPVWSAVMARNDGMLQANYTAWVRDVLARGGNVFDAATCVPAAQLVHPGEEIPGAGIFQLVTIPAEGPDTWANHGSFEYEVAAGCTIKPFGAQGDNPVAVFGDRGTVTMEVFNSTGTSALVQTACR